MRRIAKEAIVNCTRMRQVLDAYIDNELDAATGADILRHLAECPDCTAARAEREALQREVRASAPYFTAPASLQRHVERFAGAGTGADENRARLAQRGPGWLTAGAMACVATLIGLLSGYFLARPLPDQPLDHPMSDQIVASHVASLSDTQRLITIAAADRHVIKPWFQGKIDFAPAVRDLAAAGFTLSGARLDHIAGRQAAAVVYRIRNHVINVFVWRADGPAAHAAQPPAFTTVRGFGMVNWNHGGLHYAAVSDVDPRDLKQFASLLAAP